MRTDQMSSTNVAGRPERLQAAIRALSSVLDEPGAIATDRVTVTLLRRLMYQLNVVRFGAIYDVAGVTRVSEPVPSQRRRAYERERSPCPSPRSGE